MAAALPCSFLLVCLALLLLLFPHKATAQSSNHTNNWAVIVYPLPVVLCRLAVRRSVKRLGIPDRYEAVARMLSETPCSQIILMLAEDVVCNPRNSYPGQLFNNENHYLNLYGENIEVDYRGHDVNVESFVRVITGRHHPDTPRSKRLLTDDGSNILIYMSGHGGNGFLKFQDSQELTSQELADAFEQMHQKRRYNQIFFMADTCQATSLYRNFYSPNIVAIGSSDVGESSYSHHNDMDVGVSVIDRFTYYTLDFMEGIKQDSLASLSDLFSRFNFNALGAHIGYKNWLNRDLRTVRVTEFFGSVVDVELTRAPYGAVNV